MNKWFYAHLQLKKRLEKGVALVEDDFDERTVFEFIEASLKPCKCKHKQGRFNKACYSVEKVLELFDTTLKPHFQGNQEWFPVLLGLEAGLLIAKAQLDAVKEKGG